MSPQDRIEGQREIFEIPKTTGSSGSSPADARRGDRAVASALWAAYGDALGFISELTDAAGLKRRTGGRELRTPLAWTRRIGGRQGVNVTLPEGCYSDDTQLRLSTGRAIGPEGFDVEAFARVELPVWLAYALGGGKGTKAAATHLGRDQALWYVNEFAGWTESGGNGAAMRIQPHVWSARDLRDPASYLPEVLRNAVTTHGHPVGLIGAMLHAQAVAHAVGAGDVPSPADVTTHLEAAREALKLVRDDPQLGEIWLGTWERAAGRRLDDAWDEAATAAGLALRDVAQAAGETGEPSTRYAAMLKRVGLYDPSRRGSGVLTALGAVGLSWIEPDPPRAIEIAANAVGSDTDTIATMAGAILGPVVGEGTKTPTVLDADVIEREARRLAALGNGNGDPGHRYPDLLHWTAPRTQSDAVGLHGEELVVSGLGIARPLPSEPIPGAQGDFLWQWVKLDVGPTLLVKRRKSLRDAHLWALPMGETWGRGPLRREPEGQPMTLLESARPPAGDAGTDRLAEAAQAKQPGRSGPSNLDRGLKIEMVLDWLRREGYDRDEVIGYAVRRVARDGTADQLAILVGMLREHLRS